MPLSLLNHSALALFAQRTRIPTSARSIGFCAIWVCISSSSSWAGHVARMPMTRAPQQLLTGWVEHSRPNRCPEMTWGGL